MKDWTQVDPTRPDQMKKWPWSDPIGFEIIQYFKVHAALVAATDGRSCWLCVDPTAASSLFSWPALRSRMDWHTIWLLVFRTLQCCQSACALHTTTTQSYKNYNCCAFITHILVDKDSLEPVCILVHSNGEGALKGLDSCNFGFWFSLSEKRQTGQTLINVHPTKNNC